MFTKFVYLEVVVQLIIVGRFLLTVFYVYFFPVEKETTEAKEISIMVLYFFMTECVPMMFLIVAILTQSRQH